MVPLYPALMCYGCERSPTDLPEYGDLGYDNNIDACWAEEGTLNVNTGLFLCNECYIKADMPSSPTGWTVPE